MHRNKPPTHGDNPNHIKPDFCVKALTFSKTKRREEEGSHTERGVSCRLGSYLKRKSQKQAPVSNRPRSDDDHGSTAPPKLPKLSPRLEDTHAYKTRERNRKGLARDRGKQRKHTEGFFGTHHKEEEEKRPEHFIPGTRRTPNEST